MLAVEETGRENWGEERIAVSVLVDFGKGYTTGGMLLLPEQLGLTQIESITPQSPGRAGYTVTYNRVSETEHRLMVLLPMVAHAHSFTGAALAGHTHVFSGLSPDPHNHGVLVYQGSVAGLQQVFFDLATGHFVVDTDDGVVYTTGEPNPVPGGTLSEVSAGTPAGTIGTQSAAPSAEVAAGTDLTMLAGVACTVVGW